jgi:FdrA protein
VAIAGLVKPNTYRDSVSLMVLSTALSEGARVVQASAMMATPANLQILTATGLFTDVFASAGPNDLLVSVEADDDDAAQAALAQAEHLLAAGRTPGVGISHASTAWRPRTLPKAMQTSC